MIGRCLCGDVTVDVAARTETMSACHCEMCRRWSGGLFMGIAVAEDRVTVTGPLKVYRSSPFAERAWCDNCGSAIWLRSLDGVDAGDVEVMPGLFADAGGARLVREVYADRCPAGFALAGDHERVSRAAYEEAFLHVA